MEIRKIQSVCIYGKPSEGGGNELNQALKNGQECTKQEDFIAALWCEFSGVHSGNSRKAPHTREVLKSKRNEKAEGMTSFTQVVMLGEKFGLNDIIQQIYEHLNIIIFYNTVGPKGTISDDTFGG